MKFENEHKVEHYADGKRARIVVTTYVDGRVIGHNTAAEGLKEDVEAYEKGMLTWKEFQARQTEFRPG